METAARKAILLTACLIFCISGSSAFDLAAELAGNEKIIRETKKQIDSRSFDEAYETAFWILRAPVFAKSGYPKEKAEGNTLTRRISVSTESLQIMGRTAAQENTLQKNRLSAVKTLNLYAVNLNKKTDCSAYKRETLEQTDNELLREFQSLTNYKSVTEITNKTEIDALVETTKKILELSVCAARLIASENNAAAGYIARPPSRGYWITVNTTTHILKLYKGGSLQKTYNVATGRLTPWGKAEDDYDVKYEGKCSPTPNKLWSITAKAKNKTFGAGTDYEDPGGPDGTYGTRWMCLNGTGYAIHGTNAPESVGKSVSHGCVRMRNNDIEELYEYVGKGTIVYTGDETYLASQSWAK
ncbi:MAG: L,D-transpeptidase [Elusimicrobium sp.]|jgi:hypothetical protein|nr:L,D-transpeptidase [Elusimicrobium sp.]